MNFLPLLNQVASIKAQAFVRIAPAIIIVCAIVTFLADLVILTIEAGESTAADCRILLGKPAPVGNAPIAATIDAMQLSSRECIAMLSQLGISRRVNGKPANLQMMRQMLSVG